MSFYLFIKICPDHLQDNDAQVSITSYVNFSTGGGNCAV